MRFLILLFFLFSAVEVDAQEDPAFVAFQEKINSEFMDPEESPLSEIERENFVSLDFFPFDPAFRVTAEFLRTPNEVPFAMPTSSGEEKMYVKYGELYFPLKGEDFKLNIYQSLKLLEKEEYRNYLFLPFTDLTNGDSTYSGGRYIDLKIPEGKSLILDFNMAYNPYCAYSGNYSCPVPPSENNLNIRVTAGVKKYE